MAYTLAFGPFTTAWRAPQRLVFSVEGEHVVDVHYRDGYNGRGCAERLPRLPLEQALHLVTRICGTCSHAHALAFCQAIEALMEQSVPERAIYLRTAVAEIERLASHLETVTALFSILGQTYHIEILQSLAQNSRQAMQIISGQRIIPDICLPGGVRYDLPDEQRNDLLVLLARMNRRLSPLLEKVTGDTMLSERTVDVGVLVTSAASQFDLRGPLARASGIDVDIRVNQPYAAYDQLGVTQVVEEGGDVYARLIVLLLEAFESVKLAEQALQQMPGGACKGSIPRTLNDGQASAFVESPHGMLRYTLESANQRITQVTIDPPRQLDRLLARALFVGATIDNLMLIACSTDSCLACAEC